MSLTRDSSGRRDSVAASHPYIRRPSLGESVAGQMSWTYSRARSPLGVSPTGGAEYSRIEGHEVRGLGLEGTSERDPG